MIDIGDLESAVDDSRDCWVCVETAGVFPLRVTLKPTLEQVTAWLCEDCCHDAETDPELRRELEEQVLHMHQTMELGQVPPSADSMDKESDSDDSASDDSASDD